MNIINALQSASAQLASVSSSPRLDAQLLAAFALQVTRAQLLALPREAAFSLKQGWHFKRLLKERQAGWPIAVLLKEKEFYGRSFFVGKGVLVPRPDSEILIEAALSYARQSMPRTLRDVGSGTGALALTLACELPQTAVTASDISRQAARVFARNNAALTGGRVRFLQTSLLDDGGCYDIIVANLPYLTPEETKQKQREGWKEPALALDGGRRGLALMNRLISQAAGRCRLLALEADPRQMAAIGSLLQACGFHSLALFKDLAGDERVICGQYGSAT